MRRRAKRSRALQTTCAGGGYMFGEGGTNTLTGGGGLNVLLADGASGIDTMNGGTGNDFLYGSSGTTTFTFQLGRGKDTIMGWAAGTNNQIDLPSPLKACMRSPT